jgi:hypothetical protein
MIARRHARVVLSGLPALCSRHVHELHAEPPDLADSEPHPSMIPTAIRAARARLVSDLAELLVVANEAGGR